MANFYATYPVKGSGGGGTPEILASSLVDISSGTSSVAVTYSSTLASAYAPVCTIINSADPSPIFLETVVTAYSTSGFTASFNALTDSSNYKLNYIVVGTV